jgi:hypothetical protein
MRLTDGDKQEILKNVSAALEKVRFGSIEIVVHDSRVVQIEVKEKFRFENTRSRETKSKI